MTPKYTIVVKLFGLILLLSMAGVPSGAQAQSKCSTVVDCAQAAVEAAQATQVAMDRAVPKGAILAFNLQSCPAGWHTFGPLAGRVIVGAGSGNLDMSRKDLTPRKLGDQGGEEMHTLTIAEMPPHNHGGGLVGTSDHAGLDNSARGVANNEKALETQGGGAAHNIMPPFAVLTYCERE